jgi:tetratricopeptide (TPR) repeat protein
MQQVLGESVYLFDGEVLDPFGTRLVAELPSVDSALEAGRKGEFDLSTAGREGQPLDVHVMLHAGELEMRDGVPSGPSVDRAAAALAQLTPNTLFITEEFVKEGRGNVRLRDAGARAGVKLYTIVPPEPSAPTITEPEPSTAELEAEDAEVAQLEAMMKATASRKRLMTIGAAAVLLLVVLGGAAFMWMRRDGAVAPVATSTAPAGPLPASAEHPRHVFLAPIAVESTDPLDVGRAHAIRLGAIEILRTFPELRVVEAATPEVAAFSARIRTGPAGSEIVVANGAKTSQPAALLDAASGIRAIVPWVLADVHAQPRADAAADALNSFADAVVARSQNDAPRADASVRTALAADPKFLPAQILAMELFASTGHEEDAIAAARQVVALDPENLNAARRVARASLLSGDLNQAFALFDLILRRDPKDAEALNHAARYAVGAGDTAKFNAMLVRLKSVPAMQVEAHEPDLLAAAGRIDSAIQRYYTIEETAPTNSELALKIGRLSVLRHSLPIAEIEQKKLAQLDPLYGFHMLNAYIAAEKQDRDLAMQELTKALSAAVPGDQSWTNSAEIHAILNDTSGVLAALDKVVQRKEPTASYLLAHPLFRYLANDPRFVEIKTKLAEQQAEIRTALAQVH